MNIETRDYAPHVVRIGWTEKQGPRDVRIALIVKFGLHHIRGNAKPYFSITADGYENGRESFGGCCHEIIAERLPELSDVIALHLSDIDGQPMHAEANGYYWLAGFVDVGEKYHGGSGSSAKSPMQCLAIMANHLRISETDARKLAGRVNLRTKAKGKDAGRALFREFVELQRPRWKAEADAAIRKYGFGVYGDERMTPAELLASLEARAA